MIVRSGAERLLSAVRGRDARQLIDNAASVFGTTVVTSVLGALFWAVAARTMSAADIGIGATVISAMLLLARLGSLGMPTMLAGELHRFEGRERQLIFASTAVAVVLGVGLGVVFGSVASAVRGPGTSIEQIILFAVGVAVTAAGIVLDGAFVGLLRGWLGFARNAVASLVKLLLVVGLVVAGRPGLGPTMLLVATVLGTMGSLAILRWLPRTIRSGAGRRGIIDLLGGGIGHLAFRHYAINLAVLAPSLMLPLVVAALASAEASGYFYVASTVAALAFAIPGALVFALFAVGSRAGSDFGASFRLSLVASAALCAVAGIGIAVFADPILGFFGPEYASTSVPVLRVFMLGLPPVIITSHYLSVARLEHRFAMATMLIGAGAIVQVACVAFGARTGGLTGATIGWLFGTWLSVLPLLPTVVRGARGGAVRAGADRAASVVDPAWGTADLLPRADET
ncbi:MAG: hypothetical protein ABIZ34_05225 [Candidatus Limnocylindrales bacterium]